MCIRDSVSIIAPIPITKSPNSVTTHSSGAPLVLPKYVKISIMEEPTALTECHPVANKIHLI